VKENQPSVTAYLMHESALLLEARKRIESPASGSMRALFGLPIPEEVWFAHRVRTVILNEIDAMLQASITALEDINVSSILQSLDDEIVERNPQPEARADWSHLNGNPPP